MRLAIACLLSLAPALAHAEIPLFERGHVKGQVRSTYYPDDSVFREVVSATAHDQGAELRLNFRGDVDRIAVVADYQLLARFGDTLELSQSFDGLFLVPPALPDDDRRWWDLTHTISDRDSRLLVQRLDRLHVGYTGDATVIRFGRQAVSWGNGLIYNPMDFFNPFDPAAIDTEYKIGDDMLYGQYLLDSGSDWQFVSVQRRNDEGDVSSSVQSNAIKFHGFGLEREVDLLLAEHFDDTVIAGGGALNVGEAVLRGDLVLTDTDDGWEASVVANWSWSWVWAGHNVSAVAEYFHNGFGLRQSDYTPEKIADATDLVDRLNRGELFTLGRHYLAGSLQIEVTPLLNVTPNVFINLGDQSALAQLVASWDLAEDWQVLGALTLPIGPSGTEYGGLESGIEGLRLSTGPAIFAQLAIYF